MKLDIMCESEGKTENPISDFKLKNCYKCNSRIYPLCKGENSNSLCKECNVYDFSLEEK